jgi:hypothetical protein
LCGHQITLKFPRKTYTLAPYSMPPLESVVEDVFTVDGRGVRLHAGIVKKEHENPRGGFTYCHHHRTILPATAGGSGGCSIRRVAARVMLDDKWQLSPHKDDISEHKEELFAAVYDRCEEMLQKADTQAMSVASAAFTRQLNEHLQAAMAKRKKAKRSAARNKKGTAKSTGTGTPHSTAAKKQPGETMLDNKHMGQLRIDWKVFDEDTLGSVDREGPLIWLNEVNPYLAELRRTENRQAVLTAALGMYANDAVYRGAVQMMLPGIVEDAEDDAEPLTFVEIWSRVMSSVEDSTASRAAKGDA